MKILTAAEMSATDQRTATEFGVPLATLMENAGAAVAGFCQRQYPAVRRVVALCGKGNNGGDGFVAARRLAADGWSVTVALLGNAADIRPGEASEAFARLRSETPQVDIRETHGASELLPLLVPCDLVIDAIVGTGFQPPLRGVAATARDLVNQHPVPVVAVDLPSGWDADSTAASADGAIRADAVVTFTAPKPAHVFGHLTREIFGPVVVAPIGSPAEAVRTDASLTWAGASKSLAERPRQATAHKGSFGHVLVVGGSAGLTGAPAMASLAALRAGAGLVTAAVPEKIASLVGSFAPELMVRLLLAGPEGAVSLENLAGHRLAELLERTTVLAVGPGLSQRGEASAFARELVAKTRLPMVLDADALNAFSGQADKIDGSGRTLVLTPHPGEMARLAGLSIQQVEADRIGLARRFASEHQVTLVLKGWRTLIAHPGGRVAVNTSGNPAMAKGGSGDVLTGILAAMLAQFPDHPGRAVEAAVYLHGLAANFAVRAADEHTLLATDVMAHLSDAFRYRATDASGLTWLTGFSH
ncbi:MAG: NAD(P)H-hydrate dehydratase [Acidobacteriaceae bacterium]|nr:NAD(P)H-hydrate dehydratase [Acidobacteriaceae bacterium]